MASCSKAERWSSKRSVRPSRNRLVINEGWDQTVRETRSACADGILTRYLTNRKLPPRGATCQPGVVPFSG